MFKKLILKHGNRIKNKNLDQPRASGNFLEFLDLKILKKLEKLMKELFYFICASELSERAENFKDFHEKTCLKNRKN